MLGDLEERRFGGAQRPQRATVARGQPAGLTDVHRALILREFTASPAFANELGVLFQIVDDILDVTGSSETLGKQQGSDGRLGKRTYVTEFGLDGARELAAQSHARAGVARAVAARATGAELEQITDFIATRSF